MRARSLLFVTCVASLTLACTSASDKLDTTVPDTKIENEPWVAEFRDTAERGCECKDSACLDDAKQTLDTELDKRGGFDSVPPDVHRYYGAFDKCWQSGTQDVSRNLGYLVDAICTCTSSACMGEFRRKQLRFREKYRFDLGESAPSKLSEQNRAAFQRGKTCLDNVTISAADYLDLRRKTVSSVCNCPDAACLAGASAEESSAVKGKLWIAKQDTISSDLERAAAEQCECFGRILGDEVEGKVSGGLPTEVSVRVKCE